MYVEGFNVYLFYCFFYIEERILDILKDQLDVERDPNLEVNKDIFIFDDRGEYKRGIIEEKLYYKGEVHALVWEFRKKREGIFDIKRVLSGGSISKLGVSCLH